MSNEQILYSIVGAGIACIATLLLRSEFPQVKGIGYSTPGCIFSAEMAEMSKEWIISVLTGKDMVPRLNWQNLKKFRGQVLDLIQRGKVNKNKILRSVAISHPDPSVYLYSEDETPQNNGTSELQAWIEEAAKEPEEFSRLDHVPTYIAGRVIHFAKVKTEVSYVLGCIPLKHRTYEAYWVEKEALDEVLVSTRMALDHMPDIVVASIQDVWNRHGGQDL